MRDLNVERSILTVYQDGLFFFAECPFILFLLIKKCRTTSPVSKVVRVDGRNILDVFFAPVLALTSQLDFICKTCR